MLQLKNTYSINPLMSRTTLYGSPKRSVTLSVTPEAIAAWDRICQDLGIASRSQFLEDLGRELIEVKRTKRVKKLPLVKPSAHLTNQNESKDEVSIERQNLLMSNAAGWQSLKIPLNNLQKKRKRNTSGFFTTIKFFIEAIVNLRYPNGSELDPDYKKWSYEKLELRGAILDRIHKQLTQAIDHEDHYASTALISAWIMLAQSLDPLVLDFSKIPCPDVFSVESQKISGQHLVEKYCKF